MKKSLIALAVLGSVAGAAQAQSAVTLYGIVDVWVGRTTETIGTAPKTTNTVLESGGLSGSRWGLKGSEDLGGGLKAVFTLEQGFDASNGTANTFTAPGATAASPTAFNRQAFVGLAGGFGTVTFGNVYSAMDDVLGAGNSGFDSGLSAHNNVTTVNAVYQSNPRNAIKYVSPSFGGFSGGFSYSLDEVNGRNSNQTDFSLSYAAGPIAANFAYEIQGDAARLIPGLNPTEDAKLTALNGSYDLGMAKLIASYGQAKVASLKATDVQVGVDVPLSSALTLSAGYAQSKDNAANGSEKRTGFGLAATYSLSKRTTAYTGFRSNKGKVGNTTTEKGSLVAVGLKHAF